MLRATPEKLINQLIEDTNSADTNYIEENIYLIKPASAVQGGLMGIKTGFAGIEIQREKPSPRNRIEEKKKKFFPLIFKIIFVRL